MTVYKDFDPEKHTSTLFDWLRNHAGHSLIPSTAQAPNAALIILWCQDCKMWFVFSEQEDPDD
jgi:hypothetical protein